jgi:hypothetical protein
MGYWRVAVVVLTAAGALLGVLAAQLGSVGGMLPWLPKALGLAAAAAVGLAGYFGKEILSPDRERQWVRARAIAEACKSQAFRFATATEPYVDAEADQHLLDKVGELEHSVAEVWAKTIEEAERQRGLLAYPMDTPAYLEQRVADQITYYDMQSAANSRIVTRGIYLSWVLGAAGVVIGAISGFYDVQWPAAWIAVIGAASGAIASFVLSGRYQYEAVSYRATSDKLRLERARWGSLSPSAADAAAFQQLVERCEAIITTENSAWMVEWTKPTAGARPGIPAEPEPPTATEMPS